MIKDVEQFVEPNATELPRIKNIDRKAFYRDHIRPKKPVVITDLMGVWPATQKWSFSYLKKLTPNESSLYIEEGNILKESTRFQKIQFGRYVESLLTTSGTNKPEKPAYLADFNIFQVFPALKNDVDFSLISSNALKTRVNGWISPADTVASYHVDWADNLFAQIPGRKLVKLISPQYSDNMYPSKKFDAGSLLSSVDADSYDSTTHPRFREAQVQYTVLEPGEMLYIPYGWWHFIRAFDPSISINCFAWDLKGVLVDLPVKQIKKCLHSIHMYGMDGCTCHMVQGGKRVSRSMNY